MQQANLTATAGSSPSGSVAQTKALAERSDDPPTYKPPQNPSFGVTPRTRLRPARPSPKTVASTASSSNSKPSGGSGPKAVKVATASTQADAPQQFDLTIDEDMNDAYEETKKVMEEKEQSDLEKKLEVARQIAQHLGPHASTADQSYVCRLTELRKDKLKRSSKNKNKKKGAETDDAEDE